MTKSLISDRSKIYKCGDACRTFPWTNIKTGERKQAVAQLSQKYEASTREMEKTSHIKR